MFLALHGNIGSVHDFAFLSGNSEVKAIDLWPLTKLSLRQAAGELKNFVPGNSPCNGLLGYSMGGRLAWQALASDPDFWDVAIIISAHPGLGSDEERSIRREQDAHWASAIRKETWPDFLDQWNAQAVLAGSKPSPHQVHLESCRDEIADAFTNWSLGCQEDLRPTLQHCRSKMICVVGQEDPKFLSLGREMKELLPNCELIEIPNCGHRVLQEKPEVIKKIVSRYR